MIKVYYRAEEMGQGFLVIQGKISCAYFRKKWYGLQEDVSKNPKT